LGVRSVRGTDRRWPARPPGCQRALEEARACLDGDAHPRDQAESLTGYCTREYIDAEAASCWVRLGRPARAIDLLAPTTPADAVTSRRDQGLRLSRLARAHVIADNLDHACAVGCTALSIIQQAPSQRALVELSALRKAVPSAGPPAFARDFLDAWRDVVTS
jgi:hypothetical protein